jgi:GNAT superfamily N-acetyltransferase
MVRYASLMTEREPIPDAVPFDVREATLDDAAFLAECRRRMFDEMGADSETTDAASKAFVAYVEREMPARAFFAYVAEGDGARIGSAAAFVHETVPMELNPSSRVGRIVNVFVEPSWRRRGVASAVVAAVVDRLREEGVGVAALAATADGAPVYERLGFEHYDEMRAILLPLRGTEGSQAGGAERREGRTS